MKLIKILLLILLTNYTYSISFEIVGPCQRAPLSKGHVENIDISKSVGEITIDILEDYKIPYMGDQDALSSIFNYKQDYELLSKNSGRAHGWCYSVDGYQPDVIAGDYFVKNKNAHIKWIFGYSTFVFDPETSKGEWIGYCDPTFLVKPEKFCPKIF